MITSLATAPHSWDEMWLERPERQVRAAIRLMIMRSVSLGHGTPHPKSGSRLAPPSARQSVHRRCEQVDVIMESTVVGRFDPKPQFLPHGHLHSLIGPT